MRKYILTSLICLFAFNFSFGQSNFSKGFDAGYKKGYCQDQGSCISPIPPVSPIPSFNESMSSYQDGYNRGFQMGLSAQNSKSTTASKGYTTSSANHEIDYMSKPYVNKENLEATVKKLNQLKDRAFENYNNNEYQEVIDICLSALKISPYDSEFMLLLGESYYQTGDNKNALKWLKKSYSYKKDAMLLERIQEIVAGELPSGNQTDKTTNQFTNEAKNNDVIDYGQRGINNYNNKNYTEAISDITKSAKNPNEIKPLLLVYRGLAKSELGDRYGAIADYDLIIKNYSLTYWDMASVYNNKAYSLILLNKLEDAKPLIDNALKLNSSRDYIWDTKGELEFKLGNYKGCILAMQKVIDITPTYENAFYLKGISNIKLNNKKQGCLDLSRAGELGKVEAYVEIKKYCK